MNISAHTLVINIHVPSAKHVDAAIDAARRVVDNAVVNTLTLVVTYKERGAFVVTTVDGSGRKTTKTIRA